MRDQRVELDVDGELTAVPELVGKRRPAVFLLNDDDLSYAKVRLDEDSLAFVTEHLGDFESSLPRALCWASAWDMTRDGELATRDYLSLVLSGIGKESDIGVVQSLQRQVKLAIELYADPTAREALLTRWTDATLAHLRAAEPGSDHQLAWARAFSATARTPEQLDLLEGLLEDRESIGASPSTPSCAGRSSSGSRRSGATTRRRSAPRRSATRRRPVSGTRRRPGPRVPPRRRRRRPGPRWSSPTSSRTPYRKR